MKVNYQNSFRYNNRAFKYQTNKENPNNRIRDLIYKIAAIVTIASLGVMLYNNSSNNRVIKNQINILTLTAIQSIKQNTKLNEQIKILKKNIEILESENKESKTRWDIQNKPDLKIKFDDDIYDITRIGRIIYNNGGIAKDIKIIENKGNSYQVSLDNNFIGAGEEIDISFISKTKTNNKLNITLTYNTIDGIKYYQNMYIVNNKLQISSPKLVTKQ